MPAHTVSLGIAGEGPFIYLYKIIATDEQSRQYRTYRLLNFINFVESRIDL